MVRVELDDYVGSADIVDQPERLLRRVQQVALVNKLLAG
jgi:hypothetical protein